MESRGAVDVTSDIGVSVRLHYRVIPPEPAAERGLDVSGPEQSEQRATTRRDRVDPPEFGRRTLWTALTNSPGVGVSVIDRRGGLVFVNDTSQLLFFNRVGADYRGKSLEDFHPPAFCEERIAMIVRVLDEGRPLGIRHIYFGRRIESTLWPITDAAPPLDRVIVVSHNMAPGPAAAQTEAGFETIDSDFIGLGPLNVLTQRELEVLVLLGHGLSVPEAAAMLHRSPKTIESHKDAVSRKLHVSGQAELVTLVASMGLEFSDTKRQRYNR